MLAILKLLIIFYQPCFPLILFLLTLFLFFGFLFLKPYVSVKQKRDDTFLAVYLVVRNKVTVLICMSRYFKVSKWKWNISILTLWWGVREFRFSIAFFFHREFNVAMKNIMCWENISNFIRLIEYRPSSISV